MSYWNHKKTINEIFTENHGWFSKYMNKHNLENIKLICECASADKQVVPDFVKKSKDIVIEGRYDPRSSYST